MAPTRWMTTEQAAARLGVKPETLYAYVSRGLVRSERVPGTRRSRFLAADVERLAGRQRAGGRSGGLEVIVETELTLLDPAGHLHYRGWDVADAVEAATFEVVASWLWSATRDDVPFAAPAPLLAAAGRAADALRDLPTMDVVRAVVAAIRSADPLRDDRRPVAVAAAGRAIVATVVASLPVLGRPADERAPVAARLWPCTTAVPATPARVRLLDAALVLLADHELAASTLAARVAASTWADPYLVVLAGLATLAGPLHGASSEEARGLLRDAADTSAAAAIGRRLREGTLVPGFGHRVYEHGDPRAEILLGLLRATGADLSVVDDVSTTMRERQLPLPNIDLATAALAEAFEMDEGASTVIFAVSRIVGWLAHAAEEYQHRLRFRTRAAYVGPPPT